MRTHSYLPSGQSLVEFNLILLLVVPVLVAGGALLMAEWKRTRCAHQAFEAARSALNVTGGPVRLQLRRELVLRIEETEWNVSVRARCGVIDETVQLPKLEYARF